MACARGWPEEGPNGVGRRGEGSDLGRGERRKKGKDGKERKKKEKKRKRKKIGSGFSGVVRVLKFQFYTRSGKRKINFFLE